MCRLTAITATTPQAIMRQLFFHQAMLAANADGQHDGAGMTDGVSIYKSSAGFVYAGAEWITNLDPTKPWVGHVRSASSNTEISARAAHPFVFTLPNGERLFAAHNGFVAGMPDPDEDDPLVDSYQAFKLLVPLLIESDYQFTPDMINAWTVLFGRTKARHAMSEWTFMFLYQDTLHIVRGVRTMFALPLDDGYLFNTSESVLLHVKEWIQRYWFNRYKLGKIEPIKPFQLVSIRNGESTINAQALATPPAALDIVGKYYAFIDGVEKYIKL
jgi:predicted glutamine amidotransferase